MSIIELIRTIARNKLLYVTFITGLVGVILFHLVIDYLVMNKSGVKPIGEIRTNTFRLLPVTYSLYISTICSFIWPILRSGYSAVFVRNFRIGEYIAGFFSTLLFPPIVILFVFWIKYDFSLLYLTSSLLVMSLTLFFAFVLTFISSYDYPIFQTKIVFSHKQLTFTNIPSFALLFFGEDFFLNIYKVFSFISDFEPAVYLVVSVLFGGLIFIAAALAPKIIMKRKYNIVNSLQ